MSQWGQSSPPAGPGADARQTGWGTPAPAPSYGTSIWAVIAAIPLLLWGLAWTFLGLLAVALGRSTDVVRGLDAFGGAAALWPYVLMTAIGVLHIVAGAFVWAHRAWARYLGLVFAALGTLFGLVLLAGALGARPGQSFALEISLLVLVPYAIALVGLVVGGVHFRRVS
jgi:hypothetical protein